MLDNHVTWFLTWETFIELYCSAEIPTVFKLSLFNTDMASINIIVFMWICNSQIVNWYRWCNLPIYCWYFVVANYVFWCCHQGSSSFIHSFIPLACANVTIPCRSQELLPFFSVMYFFLPPFSTNYSSILHCLILPSISWSTSQLVVPKFVYNTFLGILFSSILCTCPNQCNLFKLIVSIVVVFLTLAYISLLVNILQFPFSLSYTGPKILLYTFLSKVVNCFLSIFVSVQVSEAYVNVLSSIVFFSLNFSFFDVFLFLKNFCSIKYVLLAFRVAVPCCKIGVGIFCYLLYYELNI